ncbi:MAG: signal peptidase I [Gemmatimonadetes bacterium]|nr:signal peptidase I [Gemmatimonadota bacterium]NIU79768.1 signal peptidase I [Gammaproteobacteria bacterium]NIX48278.1 signal peptidase I [Gemmatimonadota bacterium]NIY12719.1 signal peptidase I [Gemmatimonadota bacterium]
MDQPPDDGRRSRRVAASVGRWTWEWVKSLVIAFTLFLVIRTFVIEAFRIPTASMENTLLVGDFLLVNKAVYGAQVPGTHLRLPALGDPELGDVVVFTPPHEPDKNYVKRLVGMPGDTLEMRDKVLFRNGEPIREIYARHGDPLDVHSPGMRWQMDYLMSPAERLDYRPTRDNWGPLVVPEDRYFVLGDNRDDSEDSRYWGFVSAAAIKGKPLFVYYSFNPRTLRQVPWLTEIRWDRIGGAIE